MHERFNSRGVREEFEARYDQLIRAMRISAEYQRDHRAFLNDENRMADLRLSEKIIVETRERDWKKYYIAYCLTYPLDERLTWQSERDEKNPSHPVTHNQMLRAIEGINKEMTKIVLGWDMDLKNSSPTIVATVDSQGTQSVMVSSGKEFQPDEKELQRFEFLRQRALGLLQQLPPNKREKYMDVGF